MGGLPGTRISSTPGVRLQALISSVILCTHLLKRSTCMNAAMSKRQKKSPTCFFRSMASAMAANGISTSLGSYWSLSNALSQILPRR